MSRLYFEDFTAGQTFPNLSKSEIADCRGMKYRIDRWLASELLQPG